jgi:hypothetical protein
MNFSKNEMINQALEEMQKIDEVQIVEIGNIKNWSGYIILKYTKETKQYCKDNSKHQYYYIDVVLTGLRQPTKNITIDTYRILSLLVSSFKIYTMDICFDGFSDIAIKKNNENNLYRIFKDYIYSFSNALVYKTTLYLNKVVNPAIDVVDFDRAIVYDKYEKENRFNGLTDDYIGWKRAEATILINAKLKDIVLDDYVDSVVDFAHKYFIFNTHSLEYLKLQLELLTDRRTHRRKDIQL